MTGTSRLPPNGKDLHKKLIQTNANRDLATQNSGAAQPHYVVEDLPRAYVERLYGFPPETVAFSQADALRGTSIPVSSRRRRRGYWTRKHSRRGC
jgi:hypothetical protein